MISASNAAIIAAPFAAGAVADGEKAPQTAVAEAKAVIAEFTTTDPAPLQERLAAK